MSILSAANNPQSKLSIHFIGVIDGVITGSLLRMQKRLDSGGLFSPSPGK
jgi:hypothetical protein